MHDQFIVISENPGLPIIWNSESALEDVMYENFEKKKTECTFYASNKFKAVENQKEAGLGLLCEGERDEAERKLRDEEGVF
ncbi:hypothetical protein L1887_12314 [Cichorium endivia]|nr:hypothetical protein L1887_12314 [Cichorium endivia]